MAEFTYQFEDLPLISDDGFNGGLISGEATIGYYSDDGEWFVRAISLDAYHGHERRQLEIEDHTGWLYTTIYAGLDNGSFHAEIQERVNAAIEEDGGRLRGDRAEHSTHYHAYSGV